MYTVQGDYIVQTAILSELFTSFTTDVETKVQKAMSMKQDMKEVIPTEEELIAFISDHHV